MTAARSLVPLVAVLAACASDSGDGQLGWASAQSLEHALALEPSPGIAGLLDPSFDEMGLRRFEFAKSRHFASSAGASVAFYQYGNRIVGLDLRGPYEDLGRWASLFEPDLELPVSVFKALKEMTSLSEPIGLFARVDGFTVRLYESAAPEPQTDLWSVVIAGPQTQPGWASLAPLQGRCQPPTPVTTWSAAEKIELGISIRAHLIGVSCFDGEHDTRIEFVATDYRIIELTATGPRKTVLEATRPYHFDLGGPAELRLRNNALRLDGPFRAEAQTHFVEGSFEIEIHENGDELTVRVRGRRAIQPIVAVDFGWN